MAGHERVWPGMAVSRMGACCLQARALGPVRLQAKFFRAAAEGQKTSCVFAMQLLWQNKCHFVAAPQGRTSGGDVHKAVAVIAQGGLPHTFAPGAQKNVSALKARHDKAAGVFTA